MTAIHMTLQMLTTMINALVDTIPSLVQPIFDVVPGIGID